MGESQCLQAELSPAHQAELCSSQAGHRLC
uniref:Uncharacterized protein n=1 Tax=Anguilla anguilla TaxID=7936 RepID=A0A0E9PYA7_ANGAN